MKLVSGVGKEENKINPLATINGKPLIISSRSDQCDSNNASPSGVRQY